MATLEIPVNIYLEIKAFGTNEVVKRIDVTGKSSRTIATIDGGMNRNLNHKEYFTAVNATTAKLDEI